MLKRIHFIKWAILIFLLLIIFLPKYLKLQRLIARDNKLKEEIERIEGANLRLEQEQRKLKEEIDYVERIAREERGMVKKGEFVYKIIPAKSE